MKQLEQLIATGEGYQLEFKENIDKSLAKKSVHLPTPMVESY